LNGWEDKSMLRKILTVALLSGFFAGLGTAVVQEFTTTPLILHAEEFENADNGAPTKFAKAKLMPARYILVDGKEGHDHGEEAWSPEDGWERTLFTSLSTIVMGIGFAFILTAAFALYGGTVNGRTGVIWGMAGFAVFALAPGLGLSPELPGMLAAELTARQGWWLFAAGGTAVGLGLMTFGGNWTWRLAGILALVAPHAVGAPHPANIGSAVPPELASHFVAASLVTAAVFWAMLGWFAGTFWERQE
jgi:cobalt transporter subunit CbtA